MKAERRPGRRRSHHPTLSIVACGSARAEGAEHSPTAEAARASARRSPFDSHVLDLVTGERRRLTKAELREVHRLWRKHADIRTGAERRAGGRRRDDPGRRT